MLLGSMLSMTLPACGRHAAEVEVGKPVPVAIAIKDTPPAELLRCAEQPAGFPPSEAVIPMEIRAAIMRLAKAFASVADRHDRLANWTRPGSCPSAPSTVP